MMLEVRDLSAGYGQTHVITDVSLTVDVGEIVVVIGPNGHGKTTLLRAITGLIGRRSGTITFQSKRIDRLSTEAVVARGLTMIPQGDLLFPDMTVEENLILGAFRQRSRSERLAQLERVYSLFPRLAERAQQRARTLSGGERRMAAIGRGLMTKSELLLIDEPSLGLAPVLVDEVYAHIRTIADSGVTVLLVEENVARVEGLADRVYLLENGEIVRSGSPAEVLDHESVMLTYLGVEAAGQ